MNTTKPFQLGSISTGTLRTEDLLQEFFDTLEILNSHHVLVAGATEARLLMDSRPDSGYGDYLETQQETALELVNELHDALNELCSPFVYFGAYPGDEANFGFLVDWDTIEEDIGHALPNRGEYEFITDTHRFVVVDEYVTCLDLDRNIIWSTNPGNTDTIEPHEFQARTWSWITREGLCVCRELEDAPIHRVCQDRDCCPSAIRDEERI